MKSQLDISGGAGDLVLEDKLTIEQAGDLKAVLLQALQDAESVTIDLEKVTEADLSSLQLLCSACKSFGELKKQLTLRGKDNEVFSQLVRDAGYSRTNKCPLNQNVNCMWIGGTE